MAFEFNSINYGNLPTVRGHKRTLWLLAEAGVPTDLRIGTTLYLTVYPVSLADRSKMSQQVNGSSVVVEDIVGDRVVVRGNGFFDDDHARAAAAGGIFVLGRATYTSTRAPAASQYSFSYANGFALAYE